jgi:hypothetical protein
MLQTSAWRDRRVTAGSFTGLAMSDSFEGSTSDFNVTLVLLSLDCRRVPVVLEPEVPPESSEAEGPSVALLNFFELPVALLNRSN